ncbi:MAG: amidohydrolase family protein [Candidatus Nanohaloarchaea archaeon]|nr:amidohydrolase family protein [Candidatus Nanohaloarchaea archaeon]
MEWVDAHTHIGDDRGGISASVEDLEELLDAYIDRAVVFCMDEVDGIPAGNTRIEEVVAEDDRLAGLFRLDPAVHDPDDVAAADWAAGVKLHPRSQDFTLEEVGRYLDVAAAEDLPVLVHTGLEEGAGSHPSAVLDAADRHPELAIVAAHTTKGYYFQSEQFRQRLQDRENVHMDISLHCTPLGVEMLVDHLGADRVLFASDAPYGHPLPVQKNVELADITAEAAAQVAGGNADRLFF